MRKQYWTLLIAATSFGTIATTVFALTAGIHEVFPYLYIVPIVIIACLFPRRSVYATLIFGWIYLILIYVFGSTDLQLVTVSTVWFYILVCIGILISALAERYQKEERKYQEIFDQSQAGIFTFSLPSRTVLDVNRRFAQMVGSTTADLEGNAIGPLTADAEETEAFLDELASSAMVSDREMMFRTASGDLIWALVSASVIPENLVICSAVDITAWKRAQNALSMANKKLNLLNSITRHDILNQLHVLLGFLDLSNDLETDPTLKNYIAKEIAAGDTIRRQIGFTKDYQNIGAVSPQWQHVGKVFDSACSSLELGDVKCRIDLNDFEIFADPTLENAFKSLTLNSLTHAGEQLNAIRFFTEASGDALMLIFEDDGTGVPDEDKDEIFRMGSHHGYGLFLAREILDITGIAIAETGVPGRGARFEIRVPKGSWRREGSIAGPAP